MTDQAQGLRDFMAQQSYSDYARKLGRDPVEISPVEWKDLPGCIAVVFGQRPVIVHHFKSVDDLDAVFARVAIELRVRA